MTETTPKKTKKPTMAERVALLERQVAVLQERVNRLDREIASSVRRY